MFDKQEPVAWGTEIVSGITVGLIALPLALALGVASIPAGIETGMAAPAIGVMTAVLAGALISIFGGSRVQIGGPTAAFIPIVWLIILEHGFQGLLMSTMMAGCILIVMGLTKTGSLIKYIPWPVTSGFTTGIAVSIMLSQLPNWLGFQNAGTPPQDFPDKISWLFENLSHLHPRTAILGIICGGIILIWPRKRFKYIPGSMVALILATLWVSLSGADGVATLSSTFGPDALAGGFSKPHFPRVQWAQLGDLMGPALVIALLGAIESLLSAVVADGLSGDRHDSNTELVAQGLANLCCPIFGGLPATGAIARTTANINSGARTPVSGIVHAITLLLILLVGGKYAGLIPMTAMSAVLMVVAVHMGDWDELRRLHQMPRSDALVMLCTFGLTVVFDLVIAVEVGMVLAAILYIRRVSETTEVSMVTPDDELERPEHLAGGKHIPKGVRVYRIVGPFLFGAAEKMENALEHSGGMPDVLILRLQMVTAMDLTGLNALESLVAHMHAHHKKVILSGVNMQPLAMMRKSGFEDRLTAENFTSTFDEALALATSYIS